MSIRIGSQIAAVAVLFACASPAADPFYLGTWKIEAAAAAPWSGVGLKPYQPEMKSLPGKTVAIRVNEIVGPRQLACKGPKYQVKDYPADMLFQGMLGEMHLRDKSVDPVKVAEKLGFRGGSSKTVELGCGYQLDLHFIDPDTALFGLNSAVYTMKKQK